MLKAFGILIGNPVMYVDPYGQSALAALSWWTSTIGAIAVAEPTPFGEIILVIGVAVLVIPAAIEAVSNAVSDSSKEEEAPKSVTGEKKTTLPNQGEITEVPGAPPVDAGKQGKHVPGHNNNDPSKSQWNNGENGVKQTQEAWQNGHPDPHNPNIRIGIRNKRAAGIPCKQGMRGVRYKTLCLLLQKKAPNQK